VYRRALELGICGWVRNLFDGRVEVLGAGTPAELEQLDRLLRTGPRFAYVENVEKSDCPHEVDSFKSFDIR
jgi:acylphosphatase